MAKGAKQRNAIKMDLAHTYLASMKTKNKQLKPLATILNDPNRHTTFNKQLKISVKAYRKSFLNCLNSNTLQQGYHVRDLQNEAVSTKFPTNDFNYQSFHNAIEMQSSEGDDMRPRDRIEQGGEFGDKIDLNMFAT